MSTGHPSNHGFVQCAACGTWRPVAETESDGTDFCKDVDWCNRHTLRPFREPKRDANGSPTEAP